MTTNSNRIWYPTLGFGTIVVCVTICFLAVAPIAHAQEPSTADADVAIVQPFVSDTTFFILKVDTSRIGLPDLSDTLKPMSPDAETAYRQVSQRAGAGLELLRTLVNGQPVYATVGIPVSKTRIPAFAFMKQPPEATATKVMEFLKGELRTKCHIHGDYVVIAPAHGMDFAEFLATSPAAPRDEIAEAFESVAGYPAQMLLLPPSHVRRTMKELMPELPRQLGGGPSSVLTEGLQWAALGIAIAQLRAELVIQSSSESAARDLAGHLPRMLQSAYDAVPDIHKQIPPKLSQALLGWLNPTVEGRRITIRIDGRDKTSANVKLLAGVVQTIEEKTRRHRNRERFKRILLAMQNYYDIHKMFPPADKCRGEDGKYHLSWRVHILPYVGAEELYDEFHLGEPWDSPHNKSLIAKMPDAYKARSFGIPPKVTVKPGHTTFLAPVGEDTVFGGAVSTTFSRVRDGTSNTVVLVEVKPKQAVLWTAPDDYAFDPKDPAAGLKIGADGRWLCGFADGSVQQLLRDIPSETFLRLFQMNDGNPVDFSKIR